MRILYVNIAIYWVKSINEWQHLWTWPQKSSISSAWCEFLLCYWNIFGMFIFFFSSNLLWYSFSCFNIYQNRLPFFCMSFFVSKKISFFFGANGTNIQIHSLETVIHLFGLQTRKYNDLNEMYELRESFSSEWLASCRLFHTNFWIEFQTLIFIANCSVFCIT